MLREVEYSTVRGGVCTYYLLLLVLVCLLFLSTFFDNIGGGTNTVHKSTPSPLQRSKNSEESKRREKRTNLNFKLRTMETNVKMTPFSILNSTLNLTWCNNKKTNGSITSKCSDAQNDSIAFFIFKNREHTVGNLEALLPLVVLPPPPASDGPPLLMLVWLRFLVAVSGNWISSSSD